MGGEERGRRLNGVAGHEGLGEDEEADAFFAGLLDQLDYLLEGRGLVHVDGRGMHSGRLEFGCTHHIRVKDRTDRASSTRNALDGKLILHRTNTVTVNAVASSV